MRRGYEEADAFMATGRAHILLKKAFAKLPSLCTIGVRDYNAKGRWRDGENTPWRCYGWSSGDEPLNSRRHRMSPDTILPLILHSFDETSTAGLERIEVFLRRSRLPDGSFDISPGFLRSRAVPVLSNLKALLLSIDDRPIDMNDVLGLRGTHSPKRLEQAFCNLRDFLRNTPLLEHLRLNFENGRAVSWRINTFLAWLGSSPGSDFPGISMPVKLDHLTTLELGMMDIAPHTLVGLFSKFTKLEAASLWKVELQPTQDSPDEQDYDGKPMWSYYLRKIGEAFKAADNVKTFMIGWATETHALNALQQPLRFAGKTNTDDNGVVTFEDVQDVVKYRKRVGRDVAEWLDELAEKAFLPPPPDASSDGNDTDDIVDDDSEDMNEDGSGDEDE
jgi:hypothetical protein